jgi:hypothetical protein
VKLAVAFAVVAMLASTVRADETAALAAFQKAEELAKQGKWSEACPLYEASYRADQQIGVLLHLADCHEQIGHTATSWAEFTDAAELAHQRQDSREGYAKGRADALAPRLAHLRIVPPATPPAGLVVRRDTTDVTALVGTDMAIDPGDHDLVASAPGRVEWHHQIAIGGPGSSATIAIPELALVPEKAVVPAAADGTLIVVTEPNAHIVLDNREVGVGRFEGKVRSGEHTLHVAAEGRRPYQGEIVIGEAEKRTMNLPLERDLVQTPVGPEGPSFEFGTSMAVGKKLRGDRPGEIAYRAEIGLRPGRRVYFGAYIESGSIQASGACGTDIPGPTPATQFDFGAHNQFTKCSYLMPGLQLYIHILPDRRVDPYIGFSPGFRFGTYDYDTFVGKMQQPVTGAKNGYFGIVTGVRIGLDYHPVASYRAWEIGGFVDAEITVAGDEANDQQSEGAQSFVTIFGGVRSTLAF